MASAAGTVRHPKGSQKPGPGIDARGFLSALLDSSVGAKVLVALTGLGLVGFVIVHLIGNLKLLPGGPESRESINAYAHFLKHDLGLLLWLFRGGLLLVFVLHLALAIRLKLRSAAARPVGYAYPATVQAGVASRTMIWTGIVIGVFVLFHLAHYTFGWVKEAEIAPGVYRNYLQLKDPKERHDVYEMTVMGFRNPVISVLYLVTQVVLFVHLRHGIPSTFQTLGLKNARFRGPNDVLGLLIALFILLGNCSIVLAVWLGYVRPLYGATVSP
jgi:succinate dehydrogenase / fumarate reductase cytochrome b subunit